MDVALGFRTHSGWAAVVAIGLSNNAPVVCDRRLIVLSDPEIKGSKQPLHNAEPMPLPKAKEFLRRCTARTHLLAVEALRDSVAKLNNDHHAVSACGLLAAAGRVPDSIEKILASHAAIHAAEGEFYRSAIAYACEVCNLRLTRVKEKEVLALAAKSLRKNEKQIRCAVAALGKAIGPPWAQDQKLAAIAAWVALVDTKSRRREAATV